VPKSYGVERVLSERELAFAEKLEGQKIASAEVGAPGAQRLGVHRPDLAVLAESGTIAIEVELSPKSPRRLEAILRGWSCAHWVSEVHYFCAPGQTRRAIERAIEKTGAAKVVIAELPR
jgi:hypothetical protein